MRVGSIGRSFALLCMLFLFAPGGTALAAQPFAMPGAPGEAAPAASPGQPENGAAEAQPNGVWHFIAKPLVYAMTVQQRYYRSLASALREVSNEHSLAAAWTLVSLSFVYGIFHAVGPGHGKVIVTSYLLADEREVKRGVLIAFMSSFTQAVTAIVAVGALSVLLGFTRRSVADAVPMIEQVSFVLVTGLGAWLFWRALKRGRGHGHHLHAHVGHAHHAHDHDHECDHGCGHSHLPAPQELDANPGWRGIAAMILAVGLRPCTGAVLVLLFALAQGTFAIGALSAFAMSVGTAITVSTLAVMTVFSKNTALRISSRTDNPWTRRIERGLELGGGLFILAMGLFLLAGSLLAPAQPLL
ncbi:MAG: nickel/cobalt transporter [Parvibaculum sedimenti]|uniref:nickel/cobalt transporter n=1 Tax=Parvibaculum sedimenti TaxID=2608632 RepID=UPI003BB49C52